MSLPSQQALSRMVVAIDGPSGSGKSSVSRGVAARLGLRFLDTGAQYRAMTYWMLQNKVDIGDAAAIAADAGTPEIVSGTDPAGPAISVDGADVAVEIREADVTGAVSAVAAVPEVRARLIALQREIIGDGGIVVEGRDIGTVVAPDSPLKVFLTASADVRASRRSTQDTAAGRQSSVADALASVERRDHLDSTRAASPLRAAEDAVDVDTSELSIDQVIVALSELASHRGLLAGCKEEVAR